MKKLRAQPMFFKSLSKATFFSEAGSTLAKLLHGGGPLVCLRLQRRRRWTQCCSSASELSGDMIQWINTWTNFSLQTNLHTRSKTSNKGILQELTEGCVNGCHGHGACVLGKCQCHPGFDGDHCSQSEQLLSSSYSSSSPHIWALSDVTSLPSC